MVSGNSAISNARQTRLVVQRFRHLLRLCEVIARKVDVTLPLLVNLRAEERRQRLVRPCGKAGLSHIKDHAGARERAALWQRKVDRRRGDEGDARGVQLELLRRASCQRERCTLPPSQPACLYQRRDGVRAVPVLVVVCILRRPARKTRELSS